MIGRVEFIIGEVGDVKILIGEGVFGEEDYATILKDTIKPMFEILSSKF